MPLVDTHCHLDFPHFDPDREAVIRRALAAGVERIVVPGTSLASSRRALELGQAYPEVYAAVGVHPNEAAGFSRETLAGLRDLARSPRVVAVGEIGLDLYWKSVPLETQVLAFRAQVELAAELGKPVIVHDREAHQPVLDLLREMCPPDGTILHSFSGDQAMAEAALALGFYLGVDGPLTYKKNQALRDLFASLPLERILVETDAPYLTPQAHRGQRNEPAYVRLVAERLAQIRGVDLEEVSRATSASAARLFRWELQA